MLASGPRIWLSRALWMHGWHLTVLLGLFLQRARMGMHGQYAARQRFWSRLSSSGRAQLHGRPSCHSCLGLPEMVHCTRNWCGLALRPVNS